MKQVSAMNYEAFLVILELSIVDSDSFSYRWQD